jgi:6-phosphogluconolactonase (cycloisomerase 2 family)
MSGRIARVVLSATVTVVGAAPPALASPVHGELRQLHGAAGCLAAESGHGCGPLRRVRGVTDLAISPDGRHVYVTGWENDAVAVFAREPRSGRLAQLRGPGGCVSARPRAGCAAGRALRDPAAISISRDGRNVYVTEDDEGVAVFGRDPRSGALTQLTGPAGCVARTARDNCSVARGIRGGRAAVAPDDRQVYVASASFDSESVVTLTRTPQNGALTQLPGLDGCTNKFGLDGCRRGRGLDNAAAVVFSPDGSSVYVPSRSANVALFARRSIDGALAQPADPLGCVSANLPLRFCNRVRAIEGANDAIVSPDGRNLYVAAGRGVTAFQRDPATGGLTQLPGTTGCVSTLASTVCQTARGIVAPQRLALSRDGRTLYVSSTTTQGGGIAVLRRDTASGALRELRGRAGCLEGGRVVGVAEDNTVIIRRPPTCLPIRGMDEVGALALSPDGRHAYALGGGLDEDAVAVFTVGRGRH